MKRYKGLVISGIVVTGIWILSWVLIQNYYGTGTDDGRGTFGDMFGAVNSLFSGLAFSGIIYTIIMQRKDLELQAESIKLQTIAIEMQTEELGLMKEETARMADELKEQKHLMNTQLVENLVFKMIETVRVNLESVTVNSNSQVYRGMEAIKHLFYDEFSLPKEKQERVFFYNSYLKVKDGLDKYTKSVIYTLEIINDNDISEGKKKLYANILSVNMNDIEVYILCELVRDEQNLGLLNKYGLKKRYDEIKSR